MRSSAARTMPAPPSPPSSPPSLVLMLHSASQIVDPVWRHPGVEVSIIMMITIVVIIIIIIKIMVVTCVSRTPAWRTRPQRSSCGLTVAAATCGGSGHVLADDTARTGASG